MIADEKNKKNIDWKHRLPGGLLGGRIVSVDEVERGDKCGCVCPACKTPLRANQGEVNRHYFSHQTMGERTCGGAFESTVHYLAKQIIAEKGYLCIPPVVVYCWKNDDSGLRHSGRKSSYESKELKIFEIKNIVLESPLNGNRNIIPDIQGNVDGVPLLIEIAVTHFINSDKKRKIKESGLRCIEIDLSGIQKDSNISVLHQKIEDSLFSGRSTTWIFSPHEEILKESLQKEIDKEVRKANISIQSRNDANRNLDKCVQIIKKLNSQALKNDSEAVISFFWIFGEEWQKMYDFVLDSMNTKKILDCKTILKESGIKVIKEAQQALNDKKNNVIGYGSICVDRHITLLHPWGAINKILRSFADGPDGISDPAPLYEGRDKDNFPVFIVREEMRYDAGYDSSPIHPENEKSAIDDLNKFLKSPMVSLFREFSVGADLSLTNRIVDEGIPSSVNHEIRKDLATKMCEWDRERLNGIVEIRSFYRNVNPAHSYSISEIMVRNASLEIFLNIPPKDKKTHDSQFTNMMARSLRISPLGPNKPFAECFEIVMVLDFRHCYLAEINGFLSLSVEYGVSEKKEGYIIQEVSVFPFIEEYGRLPDESEAESMLPF